MSLNHYDDLQRAAALELERRDRAAERAYVDELPRLTAARDELEQLLQSACANGRFKVLRVYARVKEWSKLLPKVQDGRANPWDACGDLIAARIVVLTPKEIRDTLAAVQRLVIPGTLERHVWFASSPKSRGHQAVHVQLHLDSCDVPNNTRAAGAELQIVTAMQEAWGTFSHDDFYKTPTGVPLEIGHRVRRLAAVMNLVDDELQNLRDSLPKGVQERREDVLESVIAGRLDVALDEVALREYVEQQLAQDFVELKWLARRAGCRISGWAALMQRSEIDRFLWFAPQANIATLNDLKKAAGHAMTIEEPLRQIVDQHATGREEQRLFDRPLDVLMISETLRWGHAVHPPFHEDVTAAIMAVRASLEASEG